MCIQGVGALACRVWSLGLQVEALSRFRIEAPPEFRVKG